MFKLKFKQKMKPNFLLCLTLRRKPAPDIYLHALNVAKVDKNEAVIFEDAPNGVESGLNAGIDVVLVPDQVMPSEKMIKKVTVVKSLADAVPLFE